MVASAKEFVTQLTTDGSDPKTLPTPFLPVGDDAGGDPRDRHRRTDYPQA